MQSAIARRPINVFILHFAICILRFAMPPLLVLLSSQHIVAQTRILDREPFDKVILKQANGGDVLDVSPLSLPKRPLTNVPTEGRLTVRLIDRPDETFEVAWVNVAEVRVYEQILLDEARRLVAAHQFDEAYDYFARLLVTFPSLPGLNDAVNAFLRQNALALHQSQQHERALSLLLTLAERNPSDAGLPSALEVVAGELIQGHLRSQDYASARAVLNLWQSKFRDIASAAATAWQGRFEAAADRQLVDVGRLIDQKEYFEARNAAQRAVAIWPAHRSAAEILARIQREYPSVIVGVLQSSPQKPSHRIDSWADLRASRLVDRLLVEQVGFSAEGGEYSSSWGRLTQDESGLALRIQLGANRSPAELSSRSEPSQNFTADELARYFLQLADSSSPNYRAEFADLLAAVSIRAADSVELTWKRPHVRPESLLLVPPPSNDGSDSPTSSTAGAPFAARDFQPGRVLYVAKSATGGLQSGSNPRLHAVFEQTLSDDAAVAALVAGEIDVLDRVPPWHLARLRAAEGVRVAPYRLPTVHVLIPTSGRALIAKREFRRGLCYGIDRRWIVEKVLLGGGSQAGFEVVSGPFPNGSSLSDPIRYAYNNQIDARPFEPRLATILMTLAWAAVQKASGEEASEAMAAYLPKLVLAHPNDPLARVSCQLIQAQLGREGVTVELREFSADELSAGPIDCDFRYAELAVWEPVVDARRIMGHGGLAGNAPGPYLLAALRRLDGSTNWKDVRVALSELHQIAHHELPVIPLWQTVNYFGYRENIVGIGESPLTLYQYAGDWQIMPRANIATRNDR